MNRVQIHNFSGDIGTDSTGSCKSNYNTSDQESHTPCAICTFAIEMAHEIDCLTRRRAHYFLIASRSLTPTDVFSNHATFERNEIFS